MNRMRAFHPILAASAMAVVVSCAPAPVDGLWEHHPRVLAMSGTGAEATAIGSPDVLWDGTRYLMVYAQGNAITGTSPRTNKGSIGLAESTDGVTWTKKGTILEPATSGAWDDWFLDTPCLVKVDEDTYYLYYFGDTDNDSADGAIGLAISNDTCATWTRYGTGPVFTRGDDASWEGHHIESPSARYDGTTFRMWYTGVRADWTVRTGYATSTDGIAWAKSASNPVLRERHPENPELDTTVWDGAGAGVASAFGADGRWALCYASLSVNDFLGSVDNMHLGFAVSDDGAAFERYAGNPVVSRADAGNPVNGPFNPSALRRADGKVLIWYECGDGFGLLVSKAPFEF